MKKSNPTLSPTDAAADRFVPEPTDDVIRDYAYHLYEQGGCAHGHDVDDWFEATACLKANIPPHQARHRLHRHLGNPGRSPRGDH